MDDLTVYIGWDSREIIAYDVCEHSILRRHSANTDLPIVPLIQNELRNSGLYTRPIDKKASTEFSLTRFLTPALNKFEGFAIFADCDFLFLTDIVNVLELIDPQKAVSVVKHNYQPDERVKMDGAKQFNYPRKNWSSFMVFNCAHPANRALSPETVNSATPAFLHRLSWLADDDIGELPVSWNYLEGWYDPDGDPTLINAVHFTRGGPWFKHMQDVAFADLWLSELADFNSSSHKRRRA